MTFLKHGRPGAALSRTGAALLLLGLGAWGCSDDTARAPDAAVADSGPDGAGPDSRAPDLRPDSGAQPDAAPALTWGVCDTSNWQEGVPPPPPEVQCATVNVPFDHGNPGGKTIGLMVARQKSTTFPTGKAVFFVNGGPGNSSVEVAGPIAQMLPKLTAAFDLVFVDLRGTGDSDHMDCPDGSVFGFPGSVQEWTDCAALYSGKDLSHMMTIDAAHDLDSVRKALGYTTINVIGGSYGTRVALEYMRQHGANANSVVLDSVVPADWDASSDQVQQLQRQLTSVAKDCAADPTCKSLSPDVEADASTHLQAVRSAPHKIVVGGQPYDEDEAFFLYTLENIFDYPVLRYALPRAIHQAAGGDYGLWDDLMGQLYGVPVTEGTSGVTPWGYSLGVSPLARPLPRPNAGRRIWRRPRLSVGLSQAFMAVAVMAAVWCGDVFPNTPGGATALDTLYTSQKWQGLSGIIMTSMVHACDAWKVITAPATLRAPVQSPVKTLVLSGGIDFTTPIEAAQHAMAGLPNATQLVFPYSSHGVMNLPDCVGDVIGDFIVAGGDMAAVDTSCVKNMAQPSW